MVIATCTSNARARFVHALGALNRHTNDSGRASDAVLDIRHSESCNIHETGCAGYAGVCQNEPGSGRYTFAADIP